MKKLALWGFLLFGLLAFYQQATGNGFTADRKPTDGAQRGLVRPIFGGDADCVQLGGSGYEKVSCTAPAVGVITPVPPGEVVAAGEFGGTGHGAVLTMEQVGQLWVQAGGDPSEARLAAAVATAESGRRPLAVNGSNSDGSIDRGLFQMNSIHGGCSTFDLSENVRWAVKLRGSARGWKHWVAYNTGAYRRYL